MKKVAEELTALGNFFSDCHAETRKITWPKRKELVESTWVVAALLAILSTFVFLSDQFLAFILGLATGAN